MAAAATRKSTCTGKAWRIIRFAVVCLCLMAAPAGQPGASAARLFAEQEPHADTQQNAPQDDYDEWNFLPVIYKNFSGYILNGRVVRAGDGTGIANAQVCREDADCQATNSSGEYAFNLNYSGVFTFTASATGFISVTQTSAVSSTHETTLNFSLTNDLETLGDVIRRIVLTWDPTPEFPEAAEPNDSDLDAHMYIDLIDPLLADEHIYSGEPGSCGIYPDVCLVHDETEGSGPETIDMTIPEDEDPANFYYGVHNFNYTYDPDNFPPITDLDAKVTLYRLGGNTLEYTVPQAGEGNFWYAFMMDNSGTITVTNCIIEYPGENLPACP